MEELLRRSGVDMRGLAEEEARRNALEEETWRNALDDEGEFDGTFFSPGGGRRPVVHAVRRGHAAGGVVLCVHRLRCYQRVLVTVPPVGRHAVGGC